MTMANFWPVDCRLCLVSSYWAKRNRG